MSSKLPYSFLVPLFCMSLNKVQDEMVEISTSTEPTTSTEALQEIQHCDAQDDGHTLSQGLVRFFKISDFRTRTSSLAILIQRLADAETSYPSVQHL